MSDPAGFELEFDLQDRYPAWVKLDERPGYWGFIVNANDLLAFSRAVRDELGFDYLSMVTAVDH
jgi:NADH:ubiquinone oxidoreductase subunit C